MNKYFEFTVESDLGVSIQYIEFDEDNWSGLNSMFSEIAIPSSDKQI
jgi:hypothetical protein